MLATRDRRAVERANKKPFLSGRLLRNFVTISA